MSSNYPTSLDDTTSLPTRSSGNTIPATDSNDPKSAIIQLETKLGTGASTPTTAGNILTVTGAGATAWQAPAAGAATPDATTTSKGIIQLAGDLAGTAASPTVPGLAGKVPTTRTVNGHALSADISVTANDILPTQTGNSGKFLTTDGTNSSWGTPAGGGGSSTPRSSLSFNYETQAAYENAVSGTGNISFSPYGAFVGRGTAATDGSYIGISRSPTSYSIFDKNPIFSATLRINTVNTSNEWLAYAILGFIGNQNSVTPTSAHIGFCLRNNNGSHEIICTTANGTTETTTTNTAYNLTDYNYYTAVMTSATKIEYYVDGTLIATHTTNLPTGYAQYLSEYVMRGVSGTTNGTMNIQCSTLSFDAI